MLTHHAQTTAATPNHEDMLPHAPLNRAQRRAIKHAKFVHYPSLFEETREYVDTHTAAFHLSLKPKTLLAWGDTGPIKPVILSNGRKRWSVAGIRAMLNGGV